MKSRWIVLLVLFFSYSALAVTLQAGQSEITKGQDLVLSGSCQGDVSVSIESEEKKIWEKKISCSNDQFESRYKVDFLVPSGDLSVTVRDEASQEQKTVRVLASRDSAFFTVSFLSPTQRELGRTDEIDLTVEVLDAGQSVENASVQSWLPDGSPVVLPMIRPGVYSLPVDIAFDTPLNPWLVVVTAQKKQESKTVGGEQRTAISILAAPILIEMVSPTVPNVDALQNTVFRFNISYANGKPLQSPTVLLRALENEQTLEPETEGVYSATLRFLEEQSGNQTVEILVRDAAQNTSQKTFSFFVSNSATTVLLKNLPYLVLLVILVFGVAFWLVPKIKNKKSGEKMGVRKEQIERELAELQTAYFEKTAISKDAFSQKTAELRKELDDLSKKLKDQQS